MRSELGGVDAGAEMARKGVVPHPAWLRWVRGLGSLALGCVLAIVGIAYGVMAQAHMQDPTQNDFFTFYSSAQRVLNGESPYWPVHWRAPPGHPCHPHSPERLEAVSLPRGTADAKLEVMCRPPNLNPPVFSLLLMPLALLPVGQANLVWALGSVLCVCVAVWCVARQLREPGRAPMGVLTFLTTVTALFLWFPTMASVLFGQVSLVLTLPLVLAWSALRQGRQVNAGIWLGLLISIKVFIGLFVVSLVITRHWRALWATLCTVSLGLLAGLWPAGVSGYLDYQAGLRAVDWLGVNWNASLAGFSHRLFGGANSPSWVDWPTLALFTRWALCAVVACALVWPLHKVVAGLPRHAGGGPVKSDSVFKADLIFGLTVPAMLLLSPLGWMYYFTWLLLPATLVWQWARHSQRPGWFRWGVINLALMSFTPRNYTGGNAVSMTLQDCLLDWGFYTYTLAGLMAMATVLGCRAISAQSHAHPA